MVAAAIPREFVWRRLHSLMGLWLVVFLVEHLLTNSQAALWIGEDGSGFIRMVNALHNFPYLQLIEICLLGVPILIHMVWGVKYALTAKSNSRKTAGNTPSLPSLKRNRAYSWQRITSWILLVGLICHVVKFRFLEYPQSISQGSQSAYFVKLDMDDGLYTLAYRLNVRLYDAAALQKVENDFQQRDEEKALLEAASFFQEETKDLITGIRPTAFEAQKEMILQSAQKYRFEEKEIQILKKFSLGPRQVVAESSSFGTATLLTVRDVFKSPIYIGLYTIFVVAACFHAFNGFWTFLITWGFVVRRAAQKSMLAVSVGLILLLTFLGLSSVWGSFWLNLRH
ncbi:MAG: succinate dehydrogenase [Rhabdochlamydiaceae bacterium]|nr:succinate dehydrogenase [Rhabdochlamydiaceae bacterium]